MDHIQQLQSFQAANEQQLFTKDTILRYCELYPDILSRENTEAHMTASAWIVSSDGERVAMIWHNIYKSWAWTGGHCDGDGDLLSVAMREAREECGLKSLRPVRREPVSLEIIPVPQHEKNGRTVGTHQHLNATFLLMADRDEELCHNPGENSGAAWMTPEQVFAECSEPAMISIYKNLCERASEILEQDAKRVGLLPKTVRLYDACSHMRSFDATVLLCEKCEHLGKEVYRIVLDRSAFFPEGGGQPADGGTIGGRKLIDVQMQDSVISHYCAEPLDVGSEVVGELDWEKRFRRMQNHSGEHIVSGIVHRLYGYNNSGFHLGQDEVTLDFDGELSREQIDEVERIANIAVGENRRVTAFYPDADALQNMEYRSKLELSEDIRIVTIDGYDCCACCAPHVSSSGEIGSIRLLDFTRLRGGVRINLLCGNDACADTAEKYRNIRSISVQLSARQHETAKAVERILEEKTAAELRIGKISEMLVNAWLDRVDEDTENPCVFVDSPDNDCLRELANGLLDKCRGICCAFSGSDTDGYSAVIASRDCELSSRAREIFTALSGKGGGRGEMLQGKVGATRQAIIEYFGEFGKGCDNS